MIITRSPLRISLGGGGTDLPSYYRDHTGFVISAAIDKYVYITLHETFTQELLIKYSQMEQAQAVDEVKHPIVREALRLVDVGLHPSLEIVSMSDIPAGTGLGSSGSFTVALLRALHAWKKNPIPNEKSFHNYASQFNSWRQADIRAQHRAAGARGLASQKRKSKEAKVPLGKPVHH